MLARPTEAGHQSNSKDVMKLQIKNVEIVKELNLPPVKIHCSVLAEDAIKAAIRDFQQKQGSVDAEGEVKAEEAVNA